MPGAARTESRTHPRESSFVSLVSGWMQQGVASFFATQRILLDLAMRQNASVMHMVRERLSDPQHSPATILTELASEGVNNFIEAERVLLDLAQKQSDIVMTGAKEYVGGYAPALAMTDLVRRSVETFLDMQQEFLKMASKQTHAWLEDAKEGKLYQPDRLVEVARDAMENFVHAQKRFLDAVADETAKATSGKPMDGMARKKKVEMAELAKHATEAFIEAQKKLFDVAGRQMTVNLKVAGKTMDLVKPYPFIPLGDLTREGVKSFVDAQKALMDVMLKPGMAGKHQMKAGKKRAAVKHEAKAAHAVAP